MNHLPMTEENVRFIIEATWTEAMTVVSKVARETAGQIPTDVDGRSALLAFAVVVDTLNKNDPRNGGPKA